MVRVDQIRFATTAWDYALGISIRTAQDGPEREALQACEERPVLLNIRAMLALGKGRPWLPLVESALIEIGIVAIEAILEEADHDHRD